MSYKVVDAVWSSYPRGGSEMLLALALAKYASHEGTDIFPGVQRLASDTRQSERTVQNQLAAMRSAGWLVVVKNPKGGRKPTEYRIDPGWLSHAIHASLATQELRPLNDDLAPQPRKKRIEPRNGAAPQPRNGAAPELSLNSSEQSKKQPLAAVGDRSRKPMPENWQPSTATSERLKAKGYLNLPDRLDHFRTWARTADGCKDWDAMFERAALADWAQLGKPYDFEMLARLVDDGAERAAEIEADARAQASKNLPEEFRGATRDTFRESLPPSVGGVKKSS